MKNKNRKIKIMLKIALIVVVFFLAYLLLKVEIVKEIIYVICMSFIVAYSLRPMHKYLIKKGMKVKTSAILLILGVCGLFVAIIAFIIPKVIMEWEKFYKSLDVFIIKIQEIYDNINKNDFGRYWAGNIEDKALYFLKNYSEAVIDKILGMSEKVLTIAVIPVIVYYFLADGTKFWNKFLSLIPTKRRSVFKRIFYHLDDILGRYIISQFILSFIIGIFTFLVLLVLGVDFPIVLGFINAIANIIPYFGPIFGAIPAIFLALLESPTKAIWTVILLCVLQQLEGDIISPKIIGDNIEMHPLIVILLLIIGGRIGGFVGMVLAIPIGVTIKVIYEDINFYLF